MSKSKSEKVFGELRRRIAANLSTLRGKRGLTFEEIGKRAGLHSRHVQKIEAGESNVTLITISCLAVGLDVDPCELITKQCPTKA